MRQKIKGIISGIYKITNLANGKIYIGQSVDINKRWNDHIRNGFKEGTDEYNYPLYQAFRKYTNNDKSKIEEMFDFKVIKKCEKELLNEKEIFYIKKYRTYIYREDSKGWGYNQTEGGDCGSSASLERFTDFIEAVRTNLNYADSEEELHELQKEYGEIFKNNYPKLYEKYIEQRNRKMMIQLYGESYLEHEKDN